MRPGTLYAKSGDVHIAYQVFGKGPVNLVLVPGFVSNIETYWEHPDVARWMLRLASFAEETRADRNSKRRDMMLRAVALPSRSTVMVNLASALKTLVGLERQAFNMDAPDSAANVNVTVNKVRLDMTPQEAMEAYMAMLREPPLIEG